MKILFLTRLFYPHIGGVEKHVYEISKRLIKDGHEVHIITENNSWSTRENIDGITIHRMDVTPDDKWKKYRIWLWLEKNKTLIAQSDVIHCHDVLFWYIPFRILFFRKPVYTTFHGYETVFPPTKKAIRIRKISEMVSFGNICIGSYIQKWYGTNPTMISYGGIDSGNIHALYHTSTLKTKKIIFVGRLEQDTGLTQYLQVLDLLKKSNIAYSFEVYGDGSLRSLAESYGVVHGFSRNIEKFIKKSDILFVSSYLLILEAFAAKKLVFAMYDNDLKRDYLHMTPFAKWIISCNDPIQIKKKIVENILHNKYQHQIDQAHQWVKSQTWENVVNYYYTLWNR